MSRPLAEVFVEGAKFPPPGESARLLELMKFNRLFECDQVTMYQWVRTFRAFSAGAGENAPAPIDEFVPFPSPEIAARTLSSFLFGDDVKIKSAEAVKAELAEIVDDNHFHALNQESATTCAVEGEIVYKLDWDREVSDYPIISVVSGDMCFTRFQFRRLVEVAFVREIGCDDDGVSNVLRHVEIRTKGSIVNRLFRGDRDTLGTDIGLGNNDETSGLEPEMSTGIPDVLARHVPFWRTARDPHGISIFRGKEGLIESLHALYSQDQHDAEMSKLRAAIPSAYLKRDAQGRPTFDRQLDILELSDDASGTIGGDGKAIQTIQFTDSQVMQHRISQRLDEFLLACGIAPQSAGRSVASRGAESGTARRLAQALTMQTVSTAARYFRPALADILELSLIVGRTQLERQIADIDPKISLDMSDGLGEDPNEIATQLQALELAKAISTEEKVRRLHPEWDDKLVAAEVERIHNDTGIKIPAPLGGNPTLTIPPATGGNGGNG